MNQNLTTETAADAGTVARLLDAAERLFSERGFDAVGMRALAAEAKVNLGAATYHFRSKENLYVETFMRRFRPTNAERLRLLDQAEAEAGGQPLPVELIVECMVRPPFESGLAHPVFHRFLARNLMEPPPFLHPVIVEEVAPNVERFINAFHRALPGVPDDLLRLRTLWGMGVLIQFSARAIQMPGMDNPAVHEPLLQEMVRFIAAGVQCAPVHAIMNRPPLPVPPNPSRS